MGFISEDRKLMIIPGGCASLGGTLISLIEVAKGFKKFSMSDCLIIVIRSGSLAEKALIDSGCSYCLKSIKADSLRLFAQQSLTWVEQKPITWPLLLDNWTWRGHLRQIAITGLAMRFKGRDVYHFCHDLALSYNPLGFLVRKIAFMSLAPKVICNSQFSAAHVCRIMPNIQGILYQPVDLEKYNRRLADNVSPPENLKPILDSGARIMLTPSRINKPGIVNDKNLRVLLPVLAALKTQGHYYHGVVIGEDGSPEKNYTQALLQQAQKLGIADRFTVLPPTFQIEDYYRYADVVVTLAPREPFGRTVVEAIACGVPVVGSNTGGIQEILQNFAPNWTVATNDPVSAADKIIEVLDDPKTPSILANGKKWIESNCSVNRYAIGMMELTGLTSLLRGDASEKV